jgi:hypothetical protein
MALRDLDEVAMKLVQGWKAAPYRHQAQAENRLHCLIRDALAEERELTSVACAKAVYSETLSGAVADICLKVGGNNHGG